MFSNNSSKASEFISSKIEYDKVVPSILDDKLIDMWYDVPYFGKIDTFGAPVYPRDLLINNLDSDGKFQSINFVARAFRSLQNFVNFAKSKGSIAPRFLGDFTPTAAWQHAPVLFDQYFEQNIYNIFLDNFLNNKNVPSFKCFVKEYINFCRLVSEDISLTFSSFVISNNCTNRISGLIIDLTKDPHDDAEKKINDYFDDYQYINFLNACQSHGFKINKNAPWQLVADLANDQMRKFALRDGIDLRQNGLFNNLYYRTSTIGYQNFKNYLWQMYSDWFSVNTTYSKIKVQNKFYASSPMFSQFTTQKTNELPVELAVRKPELFNRYGEINFLKLYLRVRLIEVDMENKYDIIEHYLEEYFNLTGVQGALAFIDKKTIKTNIYTSAVSGEGLNDFHPYFFNDNPLTSENTSANMTQNINSPPSVISGGGSNSGY